jgi:hypothetical protein
MFSDAAAELMRHYRFYFFDSQIRISGCEEHPLDSDALAIDYALELRERRGVKDSFEIWDGCRLVHTEMRMTSIEQKPRAEPTR